MKQLRAMFLTRIDEELSRVTSNKVRKIFDNVFVERTDEMLKELKK